MRAKKIKYEYFFDVAMVKTRCEFNNKSLNVVYLNTLSCLNCDHYQGTNLIKKYVICSHPLNFKEDQMKVKEFDETAKK